MWSGGQHLIGEANVISHLEWSYCKLKSWEKMLRKQQKHVFFMPFKHGFCFTQLPRVLCKAMQVLQCVRVLG